MGIEVKNELINEMNSLDLEQKRDVFEGTSSTVHVQHIAAANVDNTGLQITDGSQTYQFRHAGRRYKMRNPGNNRPVKFVMKVQQEVMSHGGQLAMIPCTLSFADVNQANGFLALIRQFHYAVGP